MQRNTPATRGATPTNAPGRERRRAPGWDRAPSETEACVYKTALTILSTGGVETMARAIPDGFCRGTGHCPSQQGAKKPHAAGPTRFTKRGDHGGNRAVLGTPPACHARAAAIDLQ